MRAYAHGNGCILLPSKVTQTLTFSAPAGQAAVRAADVAAVGAHLTAYWRSPPLPTVAPTRVPTVHSLPPSVVQAEEVHGARRRAAARRALDPGAGAGVPRILARGVPARPPRRRRTRFFASSGRLDALEGAGETRASDLYRGDGTGREGTPCSWCGGRGARACSRRGRGRRRARHPPRARGAWRGCRGSASRRCFFWGGVGRRSFSLAWSGKRNETLIDKRDQTREAAPSKDKIAFKCGM